MFFRLFYLSQRSLKDCVANLQTAINQREGNLIRNEIAARALRDNPDAVIECLKNIGGDFKEVMDRCKDYLELVNYNSFVVFF